jgi:hypothetical protein
MNASLRKETRLLLPAWGLALAAAVIPACLLPADMALPCFAVGALLLALAPFGQEISLGTFSLLLSQPRARLRLWRMKVSSAATALLSVWVVLAVVWLLRTEGSATSRNLVELCGLVALAVLAGAFWTTLLFRQSIAAFWASLLLPWLLCAVWPFEPEAKLGMIPARAVALPLLVYAAAGFAFARWLFLRAQDMPWTGGVVSLATLRPGAWSFSWLTPQKRRWRWAALLQKELALQQVTLFLVPCLALLHVLAMLARLINPEFAKRSVPISSVWILWLAAPFVMGGVAVAEERRLGTMTGVLCLPVRRFRQFLLKLGVVLVAGIILGAAMPWLLEDLGQLFGARNEILNWAGRPSMIFAAGAIAMVSYFGSSLARNSLYALGTAFVMSVAVFLYLTGGGLHYPMNAIYLGSPLLRAALGPAMLVALVWPAYLNFRRIELHFAWLSNLIVWVATVSVLMTATAGVYLRPWELVLPLEPRHGPARLGVSPNLRLCATFTSLFVLLPDGRLWECPVDNNAPGELATSPSLPGPHFMSGTNWVQIAANYTGALAIRSDGSLWDIFGVVWSQPSSPLTVRQVGSDSDWKSVAAASVGFFAVKKDGSLWQLKRGTASEMSKLGDESDWDKIFGGANGLIAGKQNGSIWTWQREQNGNWNKGSQLPFRGTNWTAFVWLYTGPVALDGEGNIWASDQEWSVLTAGANLPRRILANLPVEAHAGWRAVGGDWGGLARVDSAGHLWTQQAQPNSGDQWTLNPCFRRTPHQPSKYSDWLAATTLNESIIALAADGTVSAWRMPYQWEGENSLLATTRKPEWSVNLFQQPR